MTTPSILVVEDDPGVARLVGQVVQSANCLPHTFATGTEALAWLKTGQPDLLLLDNLLPDMHALEFINQLQQAGRSVPFIITTGQGNEAVAVELMKRGAIDYIVKDVDFLDKLPLAIGRALNVLETQKRLETVEQALRQYEVETNAILDAAADGIVTFDRTGVIVTANPALREMYGYSIEDVAKLNVERLFAQIGKEASWPVPGKQSTGEIRKRLRLPHEFVGSRSDGAPFDAEVTFSEIEGSSHRLFLAIIRDISEKKRVERQLLHDAFHDKLTGLPNRALTVNRIAHALSRRTDKPDLRCAVMFLDLDRFKMVNDTMGHSAGDLLLTEVARRLVPVIRPADTLARIGGDEFAIVLEDVHDLRNAITVAERALEALGPEIMVRGTSIKANVSIGIALGQNDGADAEELLRRADIAMYRAKEKGRGRFEVFDVEMQSRTVMMMRMETELRRAIGTPQILVYYQPVVDLTKRKVAGYEALVRWQKEGAGLVSPADFIPLAEETGLICALGRQVLHTACKQNRDWRDRFGEFTTMSVNLSAYQLQREDVVGMVSDVLRDTGMPPRSLKLELTEGVFIDYLKGDLGALDELKAMGVGLAIDDFGSGYSSFGYLAKLPIETLKMDRSFIQGLPEQADHIAISSAILAMAQALKINVIAEGVEHTGQLKFLYQHGCRWAQGYLFGRPVPAEAAEDLLFASIDMAI